MSAVPNLCESRERCKHSLSVTSHDRPERRENPITANFLACEKNRIRLLISHTILFTSEKNPMTNEIASHQRETIFIRRVCTE